MDQNLGQEVDHSRISKKSQGVLVSFAKQEVMIDIGGLTTFIVIRMVKRRTKEQVKEDCKLLKLPSNSTPTPAQIRRSKDLRDALDLRSNQADQPRSGPSNIEPTNKKGLAQNHVERVQTPARPTTSSRVQPNKPSSSLTPQPKNRVEGTAPLKDLTLDDQHTNNPRFDRADLEHLIEQVGRPSIHNALFGSGSKPALGVSRNGAWTNLASVMNVFHNDHNRKSTTNREDRMDLNGLELLKRWRRIKDKYMTAKKFFNSTGAGLDELDNENNIKDIHAKEEAMCPCFKQLDQIYGKKANVTPYVTLESMKLQNFGGVVDSSENEGPSSGRFDQNVRNDEVWLDDTEAQSKSDQHTEEIYEMNPNINPLLADKTKSFIFPESWMNDDLITNHTQEKKNRVESQRLEQEAIDLAQDEIHDLNKDTDDLNVQMTERMSPQFPFDLNSPVASQRVTPIPDSNPFQIPSPLCSPIGSPMQSPIPSPVASQNLVNNDLVQPVEPIVSKGKKRKNNNVASDDRSAKPLASVDPSQKRRKGPASSLIEDRDEKKFAYLDEKVNAKNEQDMKKVQAENFRAEQVLTWDKEKYEQDRESNQLREEKRIMLDDKRNLIEERRVQIEVEKTDKALCWEREKFNLETARVTAIEQARAGSEKLKSRVEVMERCRRENMSHADMVEYLKLMFGE